MPKKKTAKAKKPAPKRSPKKDFSQNALSIIERLTGGRLIDKRPK